jgi:hypothetical protein
VSFAAITLCVASQRVFIVVVYFVIDSVRKFLDTLSLPIIRFIVKFTLRFPQNCDVMAVFYIHIWNVRMVSSHSSCFPCFY